MWLFLVLPFLVLGNNQLDDLRATYHPSKLLQGDKYLLHIARSYEFAQSVKNGYHDIVLGSAADIATFKQFYGIKRVDGQLRFHEIVESKHYFIWSFYETHLAHLIQTGTPSADFYEFFTNLHSHLKYYVATWYAQLQLAQKIRNMARIRKKCARHHSSKSMINRVSSESERFYFVKNLIEQLYNTETITDDLLNTIIPQLMLNLRKWQEEPTPIDPFHITLNTGMNDMMLYLRFYSYLYPILNDNDVYISLLTSTCRPQAPPHSFLDKIATDKIQTACQNHASSGGTQQIGLDSVAPFYEYLSLNVHEMINAMEKRKLKPDVKSLEKLGEKYGNRQVPDAVLDVIAWKAFKEGIEAKVKEVKPFLKRFKVKSYRTDQNLNENVVNRNSDEVDAKATKTQGAVVQMMEEKENMDPEFKTSYEAYQYWYLQEQQALRDAAQSESETTISVKPESALQSDFQKSYCSQLESLGSGSFHHRHPQRFYQIVGRRSSSKQSKKITFDRVPLNSLSLSFRDFQTLCAVTYPILNSHNVKKGSIDNLISHLGGTIEPTTGSIDRIFVPVFGARTTTWHKSHGGSKLGMKFAAGVRRVLMSFGVDPLDFEFVPFQ